MIAAELSPSLWGLPETILMVKRLVVRLEYEAYESMALKAMKAICDDVRSKWPPVHSIAIYHRLGNVPCREASVVIAVSSPHRRDSLDAVAYCIDQLKATVPIWKKEVYEGDAPVWKENAECPTEMVPRRPSVKTDTIDPNLVQINVTSEELERRMQNFIERKRQQVNISNIQDFIPSQGVNETEETDTCARVRTQFVKRSDSKGHLKIRKVHNEWGPQTVQYMDTHHESKADSGLPPYIAERVLTVEKYLNIGPVAPDIYRRLKEVEDKIAHLQTISPEYAQFWNGTVPDSKQDATDYAFSADDIARKIEMLERQGS
ncbi:molybdopterin synthase catalytic subunit isoform X2 [Achroia grisella]|uniref:molybdopterin synthase catalytic subunit isoform X2 n=1 Tax=Achroia grisella TaxID=688607 RepID=UPI0027D2B29C|nr:molybdopterin synthase catalytic subunit isoform X2 [Achroia grisella]